nr:MAG TPA: hypothetical protein [Caudoviricetes sp.]
MRVAKYNLSTSKSEPVIAVNSSGTITVSPILSGSTSTTLKLKVEDKP